ncbi:MAG: PQQ-binding-like beta-propeller repeat protein [Alphaproteobacteria bacterium]
MNLSKKILGLMFVLLLAGCSDTWFGEKDTEKLEGKRISVMLYGKKLQADVKPEDLDIVLPAPEVNSEWPQSGGYSHNAMQHLAVADNIKKMWKEDVGKGADARNRLLSRPIVGDNKVFAMDVDAKVSAYDINSGKRFWQKKVLDPKRCKGITLLGGGMAYNKNRVFVTTGVGLVSALNANTGEILWEKSVGAPVRSAPTYYGGRIFVVNVDNKLVVLKASDGSELWNYEVVSEATTLLGSAAPAVDEGAVIVSFTSGEVLAFRVDSGNLLWGDSVSSVRRTEATSNISDIVANPIIDRGTVYVIGNNNMLAAIDLRSGVRIWEKEIGSVNQPWVAGDYLFLLSNNNELMALDKENGKIQWITALDVWEKPESQKGRILWKGPILVSDRLLVAGSQGKVLAVSPYDGKILGFEKIPSGAAMAPVVADGKIFFYTNEADLIEFK